MRLTGRKARILDFDSECRPLAWYGGDFVTKQPTAIAWKFIGERSAVQCAWIGGSNLSDQVLIEEEMMLEEFRGAYNAADVVTGHFIRGFDLPLINGAMMRLGLEPLEDKMSQDTKLDFAKGSGLSKSQENLGAMFELKHPKYPANTHLWARANMLLPDGIEFTKKRVMADVKQHVEMRDRMLKLGLLRAATIWTHDGEGKGNYHA